MHYEKETKYVCSNSVDLTLYLQGDTKHNIIYLCWIHFNHKIPIQNGTTRFQ